MANFNDKRKNQLRQVTTHRQYEYEKLRKFLRNRYSYEFKNEQDRKNFSYSLPFRYLEKLISETGRAAVYKHPDYGLAIYKATMAGNLDIYGRPNNYFLYTAYGSNPLTVKATDKNLIIVSDYFDHKSLDVSAKHFGTQLGKIRETIITNVFAMRMPFLITAPKDKHLELRLILQAINEEPDVLTEDNLFDESVKILDLKTPDRLKSLEDEYNTTFGKFKEEIGFSNQNIDKKERLVAEEAEADEDVLKAFDNEPYENRKLFIAAMKDKFNIDLKLVKTNEELYLKPPEKQKGQNDV